MKLLVTATRFVPGRTLGGETYLCGLATGFEHLGLSKNLVLLCGREAEQWLRGLFTGATVRAVTLPRTVALRGLIEWPLVRFFAHKTGADGVFFPFNICWPTKVPCVLMLHDLIDRYYWRFARGHVRFRSALRVALVRRSVMNATRVVVPSHTIAEELEELGWAVGERLVIIPEACAAVSLTDLARRPPSAGPYLLLQPGAYNPHKNAELSIAALQVLRRLNPKLFARVHLVITGAGRRARALQSLARRLGVEAYVSIYPRLAPHEFDALMGAAVAVVLPSKYEGFGLPVLEGQCRGIPVLAADIPVFREVTGGAAAFFHPEDPEDLARTMIEIIYNIALRDSLIKAGLEHARRYSWREHVQRLWHVFESACGVCSGNHARLATPSTPLLPDA